MSLLLFKSRDDFVKLIKDCIEEIGGDFGFNSIEELEQFFGIAFVVKYKDKTKRKYVINWGFDTCESGYTPIDVYDYDNPLAEKLCDQEYDFKEFTFVDNCAPKSYPCLYIFDVENGFDRFGSTSTRVGMFIYLEDFNQTRYSELGKTYIQLILDGFNHE